MQLGVQEGAFGLAALEGGEIDPESLRFRVEAEAKSAETEHTPDSTIIVDREEKRIGEDEKIVEPRPEATHYKHVRLVIAGVPAGRIADVNRGILMPINRAVGDFTFTIEIDVSDEEGISRATLENTIVETVRQIGGRAVSQELE